MIDTRRSINTYIIYHGMPNDLDKCFFTLKWIDSDTLKERGQCFMDDPRIYGFPLPTKDSDVVAT